MNKLTSRFFGVFSVFLFVLMPLSVQAGWYNTSWKYRKAITIDHTKVDNVADPSTTYANFPVLVYATGLSNINANGTDIRFTSSDGTTEIPRQIESYSSGTLYAWVKVTLTKDSGDSTDDVIYMYYGNSGATEPAADSTYGSENVWDSNYKGVWHLKETPTVDSNASDSTLNDNHGTFEASMTSADQQPGQVDGSLEFDGSDDQVTIPHDADWVDAFDSKFTVSFWAYRNSSDTGKAMFFDKPFTSHSSPYYQIRMIYDGYFAAQVKNSAGGAYLNSASDNDFTNNAWHHIALSVDINAPSLKYYRDGSLISSDTTAVGSYTNHASGASMARLLNVNADQLTGFMDEVRISATDRSANWIQTEYTNQNAPAAFYSVGDETPVIQFTSTSSSGSEATTPANLQLTLSGDISQNVTVDYSVTGGTATGSGTDYTLASGTATITSGNTTTNISPTIVDDTMFELDETIIVTISNPTNGVLGSNTQHTYTITDNDAAPTIQFTATSSNGAESSTPANLQLTLSNTSYQNVTVDYSVTGGTATGSGTDYTLASGTATITAGNSTTNISSTIVNDSLDESNETIIVTISNPTNATLGTNTAHTYTINDNDSAPTIAFTATSSSGAESSTPANLELTLSAASGQNVTVDYSVTGGTATGSGTDYTLASGTATITASNTTTNISATIVNDSLAESNETIIVTISNPANATLGTNTQHTYTINDNDSAPTIQFTSTSSNGGEGTTPANLQLTLSASSGQNVTVDYSVTGGTATGSGTDYTLASGTATITSGNTTTNISATIVDDSSAESNETIIVTISSPSNATLGANTAHTYTILDNEPAKLSFNQQPSNTTAESSISPAVTVRILDTNDNVVTSATDDVAIAIGTNPGSGTLSGTLTKAASSGVATFNDLSINNSGNGYTLTTTSGSLTSDTSNSFNITVATANYFKVTGDASMTAGGSNELTVTAYDSYGNLATGYSGSKNLTFSGPSSAPDATVPTVEGIDVGSSTAVNFTTGASDSGAATLKAYKAETTTVDVTDGSIHSFTETSYDLDLTVNAAPASTLSEVSGDSQSGTAGSALSNYFVVKVTDTYENPVSGTTVNWGISELPTLATGQSLSDSSTSSDSSGEASSQLTLGNKVGTYKVQATSASLSGSPVTFMATASSATAQTIAYMSGNCQTGSVNTALTNPFVMKVTDTNGNPVSGVTVSWSIERAPYGASGQQSSSSTSVTDSSGEASMTLTLGNKKGMYKVHGSCSGLSGSPVIFCTTTGATFFLKGGSYQQISVPHQLSNGNAEAVFDELGSYNPANWRLFYYSNGGYLEYPSTPDLSRGKAYWIISTSDAEISVSESVVNSDITVSLPPGWSQVGGPFTCSVSWADIKTSNAALFNNNTIADVLWGYDAEDQQYFLSNSLDPWQGFWIYNSSGSNVDLIIPYQ